MCFPSQNLNSHVLTLDQLIGLFMLGVEFGSSFPFPIDELDSLSEEEYKTLAQTCTPIVLEAISKGLNSNITAPNHDILP